MSGNKEGGKKASITNKLRHGEDFYKNIGRKGGAKARPESRYFFKHPDIAKEAGAKGRRLSRRGKSKK